MTNTGHIVVAGHICLDLIPTFPPGKVGNLLKPGGMIGMEPMALSTGGVVSNTGIALHRLGEPVKLLGKVGDDRFGPLILDLLRAQGEHLADGMIVSPGAVTSYSVILSPPGVDRTFLHCPGANDTYRASDIPADSLAGAAMFHFGYPPVMEAIYSNGGAELERIFRLAKSAGLTTSLDLCHPNAGGLAADWRAIFARVLPHVDLFLPSIEEILLLIAPDRYQALASGHGELLSRVDSTLLHDLSSQLLDWGSKIVVLKLGEHGLYLRTGADGAQIPGLGADWSRRELIAPCFSVNVVGTTGSGDCTIAGFLAGVHRGLSPEKTMTAAVGVGAHNVEVPDAVSGVPTWENLQQRIAGGWKRLDVGLNLPGFTFDASRQLWEKKN